MSASGHCSEHVADEIDANQHDDRNAEDPAQEILAHVALLKKVAVGPE
jgi:hypothetical protein